MRMVFVDTLIKLARENERICVITPDMGYGILDKFQGEFPDRYFNLGICEQNCMSVAAGMALNGFKPYVYSIIPFIVHRCLEQIRVDVSYMGTDVKIIGVGSGFEYGAAGATHHGTEDLALTRALPNMIVMAPGDNREMEILLAESAHVDAPAYIRIGRHNRGIINKDSPVRIGQASIIREGEKIALLSTGNMLPVAYDYAIELEKSGHNPALISMHTLKPLDAELIAELIAGNYAIITLEEHTVIGGLGSAVAEIIAESGKGIRFKRIGIADQYSHVVGSAQYIRSAFGLDLAGVIAQGQALV